MAERITCSFVVAAMHTMNGIHLLCAISRYSRIFKIHGFMSTYSEIIKTNLQAVHAVQGILDAGIAFEFFSGSAIICVHKLHKLS